MHRDTMTQVLKEKGVINDFSLTQPVWLTPIKTFTEPKLIYDVLKSSNVTTTYVQNVRDIFPGWSGFLTTLDDPIRNQAATKEIQDTFVPTATLQSLSQWFYERTTELIRGKSYVIVDKRRSIDIVRDVFRLVPVHWSATQVVRIPKCHCQSWF